MDTFTWAKRNQLGKPATMRNHTINIHQLCFLHKLRMWSFTIIRVSTDVAKEDHSNLQYSNQLRTKQYAADFNPSVGSNTLTAQAVSH